MAVAPDPPGRLRRLAELVGLNGIVVAEPVLTALHDGADVFVSRRAEPWHVVALTVLLVAGLPLLVLLVEEVVGWVRPTAREHLHLLALTVYGVLVGVRLLGQAGLPGPVTLVLVAGIGALLGWSAARFPAVRQWLALIGIFPVLLAVWFLGTDPVRGLVVGDDGAGEAATVADPAPVVLIVLDEFPLASLLDEDDRVDAEQFPNLAALAQDATWFRNASGISPTTPEAVPPILTGRYPDAVGLLPTLEQHPDNLFTLLSGTYDLNVQESVTALCPPVECGPGALATGHPLRELWLDATDLWQRQLFGGEADRSVDFAIRQSDPDAPATMARFAASIQREGGRPALDMLHAVYPHQPWYHLPSGLTYEAPFIAEGLDQFAEYAWETDEAAFLGRQRHLLQARNADVMVGLILARLRELGTYDESLVIVTADHGAAFETGEPVRGVSAANAHQVLWVPMFVKPPGQTAGRIDDRPAETVDVLPTIAEVIGLELPDDVDGTSLLGDAPVVTTDQRRVYDWGFSRLTVNDNGYALVDGKAAFAELLAEPPPGEGDDADLRFYRFGRHGDLVGTRVDDLPTAPARDLSVELDADGGYRSSAPAQQDVYVAGTVTSDEDLDVAIAVNGRIGAWTRLQRTGEPGVARFWGLVPPTLLAPDGTDEVALYVIEGRGDERALAPLPPPS